MKSLLLGTFFSTAFAFAYAQSAQQPSPQAPGTSVGAPANPNNPGADTNADKAAASGNDNQAVATTSANADQPAKGANSFTEDQAKDRIQSKGYNNVTGLAKDADGVWHGKAEKNGQTVNVWLDYKGNVGQQS